MLEAAARVDQLLDEGDIAGAETRHRPKFTGCQAGKKRTAKPNMKHSIVPTHSMCSEIMETSKHGGNFRTAAKMCPVRHIAGRAVNHALDPRLRIVT